MERECGRICLSVSTTKVVRIVLQLLVLYVARSYVEPVQVLITRMILVICS